MKNIVLSFAFLFAACAVLAAEDSAANVSLRVMSFNIRCMANDGENHWDKRKETLVEEIREVNPALLGVQEAEALQMDYLTEKLLEYAFIGVGRDDGARGGEFSAVFYKKENFDLLDSGTFWLSETPEKAGSKGWDAACMRVVSWGKFRDKISGKTFVYANTHFDHRGETARRESAKLVLTRAESLSENGRLPFFISGDFNSNDKSEVYKILTGGFEDKSGLTDSMKAAPDVTANAKGTYNGFGSVEPSAEGVIDYIFVSAQVEPQAFVVSPALRNGRHPSDHTSIYATLNF